MAQPTEPPTTECMYCGYDVPDDGEYVPTLDQDEEWQRLAQYHDPQCHWILTKADRLDEDGSPIIDDPE